MTTHQHSLSFSRGVKDAIPLLLAVAPYGVILGIQAASQGIPPWQLGLMTSMNFAGGSEFAAISLWHAPLPVLTIVMLTFLINSRHIIMGAAIAPYLKHLPLRKILPALFLMGDEGWAVSYASAVRNASGMPDAKALPLAYYLGVCFPFYPVWVLFSLAGYLLPSVQDHIQSLGLAMAFPAIFIVLLKGMWRGNQTILPWCTSLLVSAATFILVPGYSYVLAGAFSGMLVAWLQARRGV
ncbi:AzlC family ABC transporter permease [Tatumella sp. JGM118]|uniref:AzlC family ABC transporter permease n=1 Tax=Tatumella sp. JGM118 TaxID=2799796 RepID=UPI001BAF57F9|nr:AzlC family ABC transporter permease [Tatumella sp. JGM118]MBS0908420.1 AzlC family ABC transporter permease [Tatumella sp. JGM118]